MWIYASDIFLGEMSTKHKTVVIGSKDSNYLSDLSLEVNIREREFETLRVFKSDDQLQIAEDLERKTNESKESLFKEFAILNG
jgi:hypothetical protein